MSDYLEELAEELAGRAEDGPVTVADLLKAVLAQAQAFDQILRNRGTLVETAGFVNALQERLLIVDDLPADAPLGSLIRRRTGTLGERAPLYLGNGAGQPLSKLVPVAV